MKVLLGLLLLAGTAGAQVRQHTLSILPQMEVAAKKGLIDVYYPRNLDTAWGGYLSTFSHDIQPEGGQDKMIVTQARHIWSTSEAARFYGDTGYLRMAHHGFLFLRDKMWDSVYGGFHNLVSRSGAVKSTGKEAYGNAFGIYALAAYYGASGNKEALHLAQKAFAWLERHSHDSVHKGYYQHLQQDGTPVKRASATPSTSDLGYKDQNSSIHLLEAFTELYRVWPDPLVRARLQEMLLLIRDTIVQPKGYLQLFFTPDWKGVSYRDSARAVVLRHRYLDHVSYGHDVETAFLMLEASEALGLHGDKVTERVAKKMLDHALAFGWDHRNGGFWDEGYYFSRSGKPEVIRAGKNWWAQAEGLNTLLLFAQRYPNDNHKYRDRFHQLWQYVQTWLIDKEHGDWYEGGLDKEPHHKTGRKAHIWKGTYHNFRALRNCIIRLREEEGQKPGKRG